MSGFPKTSGGCVTHPDIPWRRNAEIASSSVERFPDERTLAINADRSSLESGSFVVIALAGSQ